ncbi:hypothetical protein KIN20_029181 [Parelaphostrongylus tenuis]|uniref:Uncharacterized protein n=1 Tax=Parelaphostrongylus tenuis TaxID=148309 RepID=A0AAD5R1Y9_PARTN|nr:hypothetical protein KIN20_029181 [Parelaphostrongylus tenuis]
MAQVCDAERYDHSDKSDQSLTHYSLLHRIVGVEIDRLESRLQTALERMVNGYMVSIKNEMAQIMEKQDLLMEKLEDLKNGRC